ncbi:alpha/beta hydrolase [Methanolobus mangrovi]|uniref:Alpha/beta hydrolase n=1 Tax=Methanolobus mangrovi TaxID=3072977 RepID=A0AA51UDG1_9EURY|nr:alpha/beta hydrolase [Methanolobus mangrovi]WMW21145.1 alpha/beta hydrolase [Methanolobus mangrovi]
MSQKHSTKGKRKTSEKQKTNIKMLPLVLGALLMIAGVIGILSSSDEQADWSVSDDAILSYPQIKDAEYSINNITTLNDSDIVKAVTFKSRDSYIEGLIRIPAVGTSMPGVVILPGAGVSKEQQTAVPELLSKLGYATITIDQRNFGGIDPQRDFELFMKGEEPVEYMMVHDAMVAANVIGEQTEVDSENIAMLGLSNGGRFAIIATAIDPSIKGVVAISTSGYDTDTITVDENTDPDAYLFYRSIDPDTYLEDISPRRFVMLHSLNDTIIPYELAQRSFNKAQEPKAFYDFEGSTHGYSALMNNAIENELELIFQ